MKNIVFIILFLSASFVISQEEKDNYKEIALKFRNHFNAKNYDSIFSMFGKEMKTALPIEKTNTFFTESRNDLGEIKSMDFLKLKKEAHVYKTTFEKGTREFLMYLNQKNEIGGLLLSFYQPKNLPVLERNSTKMIWPFKEEAFVFWGGETVSQNYHMSQKVQQYAYDILMVADGSSFIGDPSSNENYYIFGKEILAPCNAKVVKIIEGVDDNIPGEMNSKQLLGNAIVLETDKKEFILFAHLKKNSIKVKEGDNVLQGEVIAQCGNSGNSTEAHLHLQLQNVADFFQATGAKLYFDEILVNGKVKKDYIPVKEDFVRNIDIK